MGITESVKRSLYVGRHLQYRARDILAGRYKGDPLGCDGFYRISPAFDAAAPFWYKLNVKKRHRRDRINGEYEPEVLETLLDHLSEDSVFWEVGAYRGYFSLAVASIVREVVAFEARDYALEELEKSRVKNGYQNFRTINTVLGSGNTLDEYYRELGRPDALLMDIEGWEYDVLQTADELLDAKPTMIIELHGDSQWADGVVSNPEGKTETVNSPSELSPDGVKQLLRDHGYDLSEIRQRRETNYHIVATPDDSS